jgi:3-methyladenine DNA glycosylase AlkD
MKYRDTMAALRKAGTAQNRKVYARHGVDGDMFGVSLAELKKLKKAIKVDHKLAVKLWASGNHDARVLATMVADPDEFDGKTLESWAKDLDNYMITDAFSGLAARTAAARRKMTKWTKSKQEWIGRTGWLLLGNVAANDTELPNRYFEPFLDTVAERVRASKNRVRDAMVMAIVNIGLRNAALEKKAKAVAKRIGPVEVDHGETGCKTPDAIDTIDRAKAQRAQKRPAAAKTTATAASRAKAG